MLFLIDIKLTKLVCARNDNRLPNTDTTTADGNRVANLMLRREISSPKA